ncbi:uncharacterized protein LOC142342984 [Convolutriloba macropyga]|uniref:uncharacterized protein LOC142342984 n=1 Tax=Convolutriloba macropyga TaxID=536237 RepID=UPI003F525151
MLYPRNAVTIDSFAYDVEENRLSKASTISTRKSSCLSAFFRVNGLRIACMADPPDYDFQPNLQKAREEIIMGRRSPSVDSTVHKAKMDAVNRRKKTQKKAITRPFSEPRTKKSVRNIRKFSAGKSGIPRYLKLAGREASEVPRGQPESEKTVDTTEKISDLESSDALLSSAASTPIVKKTNEEFLLSAYALVLLDDETRNKLEELVKTENNSTQITKRLTSRCTELKSASGMNLRFIGVSKVTGRIAKTVTPSGSPDPGSARNFVSW